MGTKSCCARTYSVLLVHKDSAGEITSAVRRGLVTQRLRFLRAHAGLMLFAQTSRNKTHAKLLLHSGCRKKAPTVRLGHVFVQTAALADKRRGL